MADEQAGLPVADFIDAFASGVAHGSAGKGPGPAVQRRSSECRVQPHRADGPARQRIQRGRDLVGGHEHHADHAQAVGSCHREPLSPAMRGTWRKTIEATAADAIAAEHAQAPAAIS